MLAHRPAYDLPKLSPIGLCAGSDMREQPPALRVLLAIFGAVLVLYGLLATSAGCRSCGVTGDTLLGYLKDPDNFPSLSVLFRGFMIQLFATGIGFSMIVSAFTND